MSWFTCLSRAIWMYLWKFMFLSFLTLTCLFCSLHSGKWLEPLPSSDSPTPHSDEGKTILFWWALKCCPIVGGFIEAGGFAFFCYVVCLVWFYLVQLLFCSFVQCVEGPLGRKDSQHSQVLWMFYQASLQLLGSMLGQHMAVLCLRISRPCSNN